MAGVLGIPSAGVMILGTLGTAVPVGWEEVVEDAAVTSPGVVEDTGAAVINVVGNHWLRDCEFDEVVGTMTFVKSELLVPLLYLVPVDVGVVTKLSSRREDPVV